MSYQLKVNNEDVFEQQSQVLLDNSPACHKIIDLDFNLQYMNAKGFKMLSLEHNNNYYNKPYPFPFFPEKTKENLREAMLNVVKNKRPQIIQTEVLDYKGNQAFLEHNIIPVFKNDSLD